MDVTGNFNETLGALTLGANSTLYSNFANISFYSDSGTTSIGSGFERGFSGGGTEIIAVPETETYFYAVALLVGIVIQYLRRRAKRKPLGGSAFALLAPCSLRPSGHLRCASSAPPGASVGLIQG